MPINSLFHLIYLRINTNIYTHIHVSIYIYAHTIYKHTNLQLKIYIFHRYSIYLKNYFIVTMP